MNPESSTEQSIKALQAQNAQFQELIMGLARGQEELKALLVKKKKKKRIVLFNTGRRFGNTLQNEEAGSSVGKDSPQGGKAPSPVVSTTRLILMRNSILLLKTGTSSWKTD